jgi:hypothetical protein
VQILQETCIIAGHAAAFIPALSKPGPHSSQIKKTLGERFAGLSSLMPQLALGTVTFLDITTTLGTGTLSAAGQ